MGRSSTRVVSGPQLVSAEPTELLPAAAGETVGHSPAPPGRTQPTEWDVAPSMEGKAKPGRLCRVPEEKFWQTRHGWGHPKAELFLLPCWSSLEQDPEVINLHFLQLHQIGNS